MQRVLGISGYYHDSAAALVVDGDLTAAAQEERFTRIKHDARFPAQAISFCLGDAGLAAVDYIVFYEKPLLKFERLLETYMAFAPRGFGQFLKSMPVWVKDKLFLKQVLKRELSKLSGIHQRDLPPLLFSQHHQSHAASAFYTSPFDDAAVLCVDGVGEWATTSAWHGGRDSLSPLWQIDFPHSLGLLYSAFTYFCGFKVNSGEYKLMGLAPYGSPVHTAAIKDNLIDIHADGSYRLNLDFFAYHTGDRMISEKFRSLWGCRERSAEQAIRPIDLDLAASIQAVTTEIMLKLAAGIQSETGSRNLCLAGGVALNCVTNGELRRAGVFDDIWVQPAAGDAGGAIGAAMMGWHEHLSNPKQPQPDDGMHGCLLGPAYSNQEIETRLSALGAVYSRLDDNETDRVTTDRVATDRVAIDKVTADLLADGNVVGWFQDRMEFGPRALGARSILGDPRDPDMQRRMNLQIKGRESFRPFAPAILDADVDSYFDTSAASPYMSFVEQITTAQIRDPDSELTGLDSVNEVRSTVPAVTHVDHSARLQTVDGKRHPRFHQLLQAFKAATGCPVLINTSFNVRGEPIVCSPEDAFRCFMTTDMDYLVIGDMLLDKRQQTADVPRPVFEDD